MRVKGGIPLNFIRAFNQTLDYLETVIEDRIDEEKVSQISGYSLAMFSRLFSVMTEMSLSEYYRQRKLSCAAQRLISSEERIIDLALRYGYESPDSFSNAFKKFHGFSPSEVRKGQPYRVFSRIQLTLTIKGERTMKVTIEKKLGFKVAGIDKVCLNSEECAGVWAELFSRYSHEEMATIGTGQSVGICHDMTQSNQINYMAGYVTNDLQKAEKMDLSLIEIASGDYAIIELKGPVPVCIHQGWKYFMEVFCPEQGFRHAGTPDLEYYLEGDMASQEYQMELWVPVKKV